MDHTVTGPAVALGWSLTDIADAVGGTLVGDDASVDAVVTDSRIAGRGDLFVAIAGENHDGHEFATSALANGAAGAVVEASAGLEVEPRVVVNDTCDALRALAVRRRGEIAVPVIAITGSTGKTSTKDLLAAAVPGSHASPRSYNNEIGVPLTILGAPASASALIVEVGSRGAGHIRWLMPAVRPDVAIITNLGLVHLETFGSEEGLADAKYELVEALAPEGVAVVPSDEPRLHRGFPNTVTFGFPPADVAVADLVVGADGRARCTLVHSDRRYPLQLSMAGEHQPLNAAAALAAASALDVDLETAVAGMAEARGSDWRMDVTQGTYIVVNDAYNANPQSMRAALKTVASMGHRTIAVLGPMAELGSVCEREHAAIGALAVDLDVAAIVVVGPDHGYRLGAPELVTDVGDIDEALDTLRALLEPGDVVLVKASRSAGLERVALSLIEEAAS